MRIGEMFANKLKYLEREILAFKTSHFKTATTISTMSKVVRVGFDLVLHQYLYEWISSGKIALITLTTEDDTTMLSNMYIRGLTQSTLGERTLIGSRLVSSAPNQAKYELWMYSYSYDDYVTLSGGGQIHLDFDVECIGTSRFRVDVEYVNNYRDDY